jgi:hypothetical protein
MTFSTAPVLSQSIWAQYYYGAPLLKLILHHQVLKLNPFATKLIPKVVPGK